MKTRGFPHFRHLGLTAALLLMLLTACGTTAQSDHHASCAALVSGRTDGSATPRFGPNPPAPTRSWSDPDGWQTGRVPEAGEDVVITANEVVLLDVSPPELGLLNLDGALVFGNSDLELQVAGIMITGGLFVGSEAAPFMHSALITVGSEERAHRSDCLGDNYIGLLGGVLEAHGNPDGPAWTRLTATATPGATTITVEDATGWRTGDRVAIASTDFYTPRWLQEGGSVDRQVEERTIVRVDGNTLTLDEPFAYTHEGVSRTYGGGAAGQMTLEARAEVMRLTRNVTIRGLESTADPESSTYRHGAHIMALGNSRVQLDSVELTAMGQTGVLARYPVHFHLQGQGAAGSSVKNSSLHHLYSRCVTIHGSSGVHLDANAAYDTLGHCYFLEDGAETGNLLTGNLGMVVREPPESQRLIPTDGGHMGPSVFWVTNPDNVLEGNVAASSAGSGFWYSLPEHPTGPSYAIFGGADIWPRRTPLGSFRGNVAHSNYNDGLHVDLGPAEGTLRPEAAWYRPRTVPGDQASEPVPAIFEGYVAYKHRAAAAWFRGDNTWLTRSLLVDNAIGVTFASSNSGLKESVLAAFVEDPPPEGFFRDGFAVRGFEFYDGPVRVEDTHFGGYAWDPRGAAALSILDYTSFSLSPVSSAAGLTFGPGTNRVRFTSRTLEERDKVDRDSGEDGYASGLFLDADGSVTGVAGVAVTVNNPLLQVAGCTHREEWNANVCQARYAALTLRNEDAPPRQLGPTVLTREASASAPAASHTMFGSPNGGVSTPNVHFRALVPLGLDYSYEFLGRTPNKYVIELRTAETGDVVTVSVPYRNGAPASLWIYRDYWIHERGLLREFGSLQQFRASSEAGYYLGDTTLHVRLQVQQVESQPARDWAHLTVSQVRLH